MANEIKCPWCGEVTAKVDVELAHKKKGEISVTERRCTRCHKVLAAYLEEEGDFLMKMRNF